MTNGAERTRRKIRSDRLVAVPLGGGDDVDAVRLHPPGPFGGQRNLGSSRSGPG